MLFTGGDEAMKIADKDLELRPVGCVFVGNPLSFSDTALALVEDALPCISCIRTASVNDLLLMGAERSEATRLIVVDECKIDELIVILPQLRSTFPMTNIALAYRQTDRARAFVSDHHLKTALTTVSFLPMNINVDSWLSVVRLLATGEDYLPKELLGGDITPPQMLAQPEPNIESPPQEVHLTTRELEVLKSAAEGKQNKIIADELKLSQHTVKLHMHHIIAKLGVHNRTEAANWYHGHKL